MNVDRPVRCYRCRSGQINGLEQDNTLDQDSQVRESFYQKIFTEVFAKGTSTIPRAGKSNKQKRQNSLP